MKETSEGQLPDLVREIPMTEIEANHEEDLVTAQNLIHVKVQNPEMDLDLNLETVMVHQEATVVLATT